MRLLSHLKKETQNVRVLSKDTMFKSLITFIFFIFSNIPHFVFAQTPNAPINTVAYTFTVKNTCRTSAGVYTNTPDSTLIRTLWSNVTYDAGTYNIKWDGKDDNGAAAPVGNYTVKVVSNNVNYTWEGVIGNNSTNLSGPDVWGQYGTPLSDMVEVPVGGKKYMYCTNWFAEACAGQMKFDEAKPNERIQFINTNQGQAILFTCASPTMVFYAGWDYPNTNNYVMATSVATDAFFKFSAGSSIVPTVGQSYTGVIDLNSAGAAGKPSGMAVQQGGNQYLFVAHAAQNVINVYKTSDGSGSLVTTIPIAGATNLTLETDNVMWIAQGTTLTKYTVNANGSITPTSSQITGFARVAGVSVLNGDLCVLDAGNQQIVKRYNSTSLALTGTIGQVGGYASSPTVADNKFYEEDTRGTYYTFVRHQSDGSIWICDPGNSRNQHFSSSGAYINNIMFLKSQYCVNVCLNKPTQVFSNFMEFTIDYSKPLATGWTLTNNWGYNVTSYFDPLSPIAGIILMPNNRIYMLCRASNNHFFSELTSKGLRIISPYVGVWFPTITADGTLTNQGFQSTVTFTRFPLTGFDVNNNPLYGPGVVTAKFPLGNSGGPGNSTWAQTTSNILTIFDRNINTSGTRRFHLTGFDLAQNKVVWRTCPDTYPSYSGDYPMDGTFDTGNTVQHPGNEVNTIGNNIFWGYNGEFWKFSETGIIYHYNDRGLMLGMWGVLGPDVVNSPAAAGYAANTISLKPVQVGNSIYIYANDEEKHSALHRWKVTGLNTIVEQDIPIQLPTPMLTPPAPTGTNLLTGLASQAIVVDGLYGWHRSNGEDYTDIHSKYFTVTSGSRSYGQSMDLYAQYRQPAGVYTVTRDLGNNSGLNAWNLSGQLSLFRNFPNETNGSGGSYIEVLDNNGKVITRFYEDYYTPGYINVLHANDQILTSMPQNPMTAITQHLQPFEMSASNGIFTFNYAGYTAQTSTIVDPLANWKNPKTFRVYFWTTANTMSRDRCVDFQSLMFTPGKINQTLNFDAIPQKVVGDAPFTVFAISSSNSPVTYSILSGPATISGNIITITGAGTVVVQASQPGDLIYSAAAPVSQTFIVATSRVDL